ncbi:MAG: hypothetical protein ACAH80_07390 [Alphaproteobacteria bacterium]
MAEKKKEFDAKAKPLTAKEQVALTAQLAVEMAKAFPDAGSVSAEMGGIKITLKQRQPK